MSTPSDIAQPGVAGRDGSFTAFFGTGEVTFRLDIGALRRLEDRRKAGIFAIHDRMVRAAAYVDDVVEILRQGLIGGGMTAVEADGLVRHYGPAGSVSGALVDSYGLALRVLDAAMVTPEGEALPGKTEAGAGQPG